MEPAISAHDLIKLLEESILTFRLFLKKDKRKGGVLMSAHGHTGSSIQQVQSSLDKVSLILWGNPSVMCSFLHCPYGPF
jgi:hypothetical protein